MFRFIEHPMQTVGGYYEGHRSRSDWPQLVVCYLIYSVPMTGHCPINRYARILPVNCMHSNVFSNIVIKCLTG